MMECERCWKPTRTIDSRSVNGMIRRRRQCQNCEHRFTTFELSKTVIDQMIDMQKRYATLQQALSGSPNLGVQPGRSPKALRYINGKANGR